MDPIEYMKKFAKFLLASQIIGLFLSLLLAISPERPFLSLFFCLAAGFIMAHLFFKEVQMNISLYGLSFLLYMLMMAISVIPLKAGVEGLVGLFIWNIIFGFLLVLIIPAKRFFPPFIHYLRENHSIQALFSQIFIKERSAIVKSGLIVLGILVIWVSVSWMMGSNKDAKCRELKTLASDYRALIAEHSHMAEECEREAERYFDGYGHVLDSVLAGTASQLESYGHSGQAGQYAKKLEEVEQQMRKLGCD